MRKFGDINNVFLGQHFKDRSELRNAGVHTPTQAGISGSEKVGAESIVLSGGYEDDEDHGHHLIYTGQGGRDDKTLKQVEDQKLIRGNLALARSKINGSPVRVTRGHKHKGKYSPKSGYTYSGLFYVEDYWQERGKSGFLVWRFRLVSEDLPLVHVATKEDSPSYEGIVARKEALVQKQVRDSSIAHMVKEKHKHRCQVCGVALETKAGFYAEAAHIKPLGAPHNGPDIESNILCLCPNHHVLFDNGAFSINDDLSLLGLPGKLRTHKNHEINLSCLKYHREHYHGGV